MANNTSQEIVKQAGNSSNLLSSIPESAIVIPAVILLTGISGAAIYLYFNDKKYNYITRASAWIAGKISSEDETKGIKKEELKESTEEVVENNDVNATSPEELFKAIESFAEEKEHSGRAEERKKQREDENLKDILTVVLITSGANLLLRLFEMFA